MGSGSGILLEIDDVSRIINLDEVSFLINFLFPLSFTGYYIGGTREHVFVFESIRNKNLIQTFIVAKFDKKKKREREEKFEERVNRKRGTKVLKRHIYKKWNFKIRNSLP